MGQRIAYIISAGPTEGRGVPDAALVEGFDVSIVQSQAAPFAGDAVDLMITEMSTVEAAMRAESEGHDAVVIGAVADYGIDTVRAAVGVPVVGCGQASMLVASGLGRRFAIVTIWPASTSGHYRSILEGSGLADRCTSVRHVSTDAEMATLADDENFYTEMRAGRESMIARIVAEMEAAVRDDGADAMVLGCNCMTPVAGVLAERIDVPVIDPTTTGYQFAVMLVSLGLQQSRAAYPRALNDRRELFGDVAAVARAQLEAAGGLAECEVCVLGDDGAASCEARPASAEPVQAG